MNKLGEQVFCRSCQRKTNHEILSKQSDDGTEFDGSIWWHDSYYIVRCLGCNTLAFVREYCSNDMVMPDEKGDLYHFEDYTVYPEEPEHLKNGSYRVARSFQHVPVVVLMLYRQVIDALNHRMELLSAAGLRVIVEAVCLDLGVKRGTLIDPSSREVVLDKDGKPKRSEDLEGKIFGLHERDIITLDQSFVLQQIRVIGNRAVHRIHAPRTRTMQKAIDVIETMLTAIYEMKEYQELSDQM